MITKHKIFKLEVANEGQQVFKEFEVDSSVQSVIGIALTSDRVDALLTRGTLRLEISSVEVVEEGLPAANFVFGINANPRYFQFGELDMNTSDRRLKFRFQDNAVAGQTFSAYKVDLTLICKVN